MKKTLSIFLFICAFLFLWQLIENAVDYHRIENDDTSIELFIASPHTIIKTFVVDGGVILSNLGYTLARAGGGLLLGILLAFVVSIVFLFFPTVRNIGFPFSFAMNSFPIVGFAPLIILAFGQGSWFSIVFVSMIISYFPILVGLDSSFRNVSKDILEVMRVFNATQKQMLFKIFLPSAIPGFLTALRLAIPASIIGATIGEWLGVRTGIGQLITVAMYQLRPGLLYASLISVTVAGVICVGILVFVEKKLLVWKQ
ncbi:MAG: ABC transporter permease subunit [Patescibacteria group bacterium]